jgi:hypothetical protein
MSIFNSLHSRCEEDISSFLPGYLGQTEGLIELPVLQWRQFSSLAARWPTRSLGLGRYGSSLSAFPPTPSPHPAPTTLQRENECGGVARHMDGNQMMQSMTMVEYRFIISCVTLLLPHAALITRLPAETWSM